MLKKLFIYNKDNKFGFCEFDKHVIVNPIYDQVKEFISDYTWVQQNNFWFMIDINQKKLLEQNNFDNLLHFDIDHSIAKKDDKYFLINNVEKTIKQIKYEFIDFNNEILLVKNNENKYLFLNNQLQKINNVLYDYAIGFNDFFAPVSLNNKWGVINNSGKIIIDFQYDKINKFSSYLFKVQKDNKNFFIDIKQQKYLQNFNQDFIFNDNYENNALIFQYKNKWGMMDDFFEIQFIKKIDWLSNFDEEYAFYKMNNKYGIINKNGIKKTSNIFDEIYYKCHEYFYVKKDNKLNYYWLSKKRFLF